MMPMPILLALPSNPITTGMAARNRVLGERETMCSKDLMCSFIGLLIHQLSVHTQADMLSMITKKKILWLKLRKIITL